MNGALGAGLQWRNLPSGTEGDAADACAVSIV